MTEKEAALEEAISIAGGQTALARLLTAATGRLYVQPVVANWRKRGQVPADSVAAIEQVTGVSCHSLRPDVFPNSRKKGQAAKFKKRSAGL